MDEQTDGRVVGMTINYPPDKLEEYQEDDGTMPENVATLASAVVGQRIVKVERGVAVKSEWGLTTTGTQITLDNGKRVNLIDTDDCCAYTALDKFLLHPERVNHAIMGVATTDGYTKWHIYADLGDVLELEVGWSAGNPFYYAYGFEITVEDAE
jgi:hypothetical protein